MSLFLTGMDCAAARAKHNLPCSHYFHSCVSSCPCTAAGQPLLCCNSLPAQRLLSRLMQRAKAGEHCHRGAMGAHLKPTYLPLNAGTQKTRSCRPFVSRAQVCGPDRAMQLSWPGMGCPLLRRVHAAGQLQHSSPCSLTCLQRGPRLYSQLPSSMVTPPACSCGVQLLPPPARRRDTATGHDGPGVGGAQQQHDCGGHHKGQV